MRSRYEIEAFIRSFKTYAEVYWDLVPIPKNDELRLLDDMMSFTFRPSFYILLMNLKSMRGPSWRPLTFRKAWQAYGKYIRLGIYERERLRNVQIYTQLRRYQLAQTHKGLDGRRHRKKD